MKDADVTRQRLLQSARLRFARDGYAGTTVRDIAADAGVNVALINRYFASKEGLFEACLERSKVALEPSDEPSFDQVLTALRAQVADSPDGEQGLQLLLLLRSSGDDTIDRIRRDTLRRYSEYIAVAAGARRDDPLFESLVLRAQVALAAVLGVVVLRSGTTLEPIRTDAPGELGAVVEEIVRALLRH